VVSRLDARGYEGFDLFFLASGALSLTAILFLPVIARAKPRAA
jgi:PAT family beta-lactamase induction signal transducer AmpG